MAALLLRFLLRAACGRKLRTLRAQAGKCRKVRTLSNKCPKMRTFLSFCQSRVQKCEPFRRKKTNIPVKFPMCFYFFTRKFAKGFKNLANSGHFCNHETSNPFAIFHANSEPSRIYSVSLRKTSNPYAKNDHKCEKRLK